MTQVAVHAIDVNACHILVAILRSGVGPQNALISKGSYLKVAAKNCLNARFCTKNTLSNVYGNQPDFLDSDFRCKKAAFKTANDPALVAKSLISRRLAWSDPTHPHTGPEFGQLRTSRR